MRFSTRDVTQVFPKKASRIFNRKRVLIERARMCQGSLPRDLVAAERPLHNSFDHTPKAKIVMLEKSLSGRASGHRSVVFKIRHRKRSRTIGRRNRKPSRVDRAIEIAARP